MRNAVSYGPRLQHFPLFSFPLSGRSSQQSGERCGPYTRNGSLAPPQGSVWILVIGYDYRGPGTATFLSLISCLSLRQSVSGPFCYCFRLLRVLYRSHIQSVSALLCSASALRCKGVSKASDSGMWTFFMPTFRETCGVE